MASGLPYPAIFLTLLSGWGSPCSSCLPEEGRVGTMEASWEQDCLSVFSLSTEGARIGSVSHGGGRWGSFFLTHLWGHALGP